jgi:hypothetical protein
MLGAMAAAWNLRLIGAYIKYAFPFSFKMKEQRRKENKNQEQS